MTERDVFAMAALPAVYEDLMRHDFDNLDFEQVARLAYRMGDAMLSVKSGNEKVFAGWANRYENGEIGALCRDKSLLAEQAADGVVEVVEVYISTAQAVGESIL